MLLARLFSLPATPHHSLPHNVSLLCPQQTWPQSLSSCQHLLWCPQLVMLGSGHPPYEAAMREQEERHPQHFRGWVGFSIPVAHRIVAGALLYKTSITDQLRCRKHSCGCIVVLNPTTCHVWSASPSQVPQHCCRCIHSV